MPKTEPKKFDISKSFPQVLLVGNGITRYGGCYKSWPEVIGLYAGDEYAREIGETAVYKYIKIYILLQLCSAA